MTSKKLSEYHLLEKIQTISETKTNIADKEDDDN